MTDVGTPPPGGGRVRQYASDAERARAWRERRREAAGDRTDTADPRRSPELAVAALAAIVPALRDVAKQAEARIAEQVRLVEDAVELLSDPDALDERLESARLEAARLVTEAQATAQTARTETARARKAEEAAQIQAEEAARAADAISAELARVEAELEQLRDTHRDLQHDHRQAVEERDQARDVFQALSARYDEETAAAAERLRRETARADSADRELHEAHTLFQDERDAHRTELAARADAAAELKAELRGVTAERDGLTARISDLSRQSAAELQRLEAAAERRLDEVRELLGRQIAGLEQAREKRPAGRATRGTEG